MEPIVLDNGSGLMKAGFSGEDLPRAILPTCAGKAKNPEWLSSQASNIKADLRDRDTFVGTECQQYREYLDVVSPITRGQIEDWDTLERIWEYIFTHELRVQPETATLPVRDQYNILTLVSCA
jgi:actin-related protein